MYRVIQTKSFQEQLDGLYVLHSRMDEFNNAITWFLGRTPRSLLCFKLDDANHFLWVTDQLPTDTIPKVSIVYHVDDVKRIVTLKGIKKHVDQP